MKKKTLHIVSFDNPYPANYGGVIDVFYKLQCFKELNFEIILHIYSEELKSSKVLNELCNTIYYYKRKKQWYKHLSLNPFVVVSRFDSLIINNLNKDNHPILFEGLHTSLPIFNKHLNNRKFYLRAHNIEHNYYKGLAKSETKLLKKVILSIESIKLKLYEKKVFNKINTVLPISNYEFSYFKKAYDVETVLLPVFHKNIKVINLNPIGNYALYQGDLRVSDNKRVVSRLIKMFNDINFTLLIASNVSEKKFNKLFPKRSINIKYEKIINDEHLDLLFEGAHVNTIFSYQNSGTKLKLINALYNSRFCLINDNMIDENSIKKICNVENDLLKYKKEIKTLILKDFKLTDERISVLQNYIVENKLILQKTFN